MRRKDLLLVLTIGLALSGDPRRGFAQIERGTGLRDLLARTPAESLVVPLRRLESDRAHPEDRAEAALALGRLHFARSEYAEAAAAFARAAARLEPARKPEARYWAGVSWLGLGEPVQARAALEEVASVSGPRRVDALLGIAQAWELARNPQRALATLEPLIDMPLGESGPAVLERVAALADGSGKDQLARKARERLLGEYARSIEAASVRLTLVNASQASGSAAFAVVAASFVDPARARSLASEARRAGFPQAQVVTRGQGLTAIHIVRLGTYPTSQAARKAGDQAAHALGVAYEIVRAP